MDTNPYKKCERNSKNLHKHKNARNDQRHLFLRKMRAKHELGVLKSYINVALLCIQQRLLLNLIICLSQGQIFYQLILGFLLLSSTLSIRDALRPKNLIHLLIVDNFYTIRLIRLIRFCQILYSLLRSHKEPRTTHHIEINQKSTCI